MATGVIKKIVSDRGFGFIKQEKGADVFFHHSITEGFDQLREGQTVTFDSAPGDRGLRATRVVAA